MSDTLYKVRHRLNGSGDQWTYSDPDVPFLKTLDQLYAGQPYDVQVVSYNDYAAVASDMVTFSTVAGDVGLANDNGSLVLSNPTGWPTSPTGLPPGAVWNNFNTVCVVPGAPIGPGPMLRFPGVSAAELLANGAANIYASNPFNLSYLFNNGNTIGVSLGRTSDFTSDFTPDLV